MKKLYLIVPILIFVCAARGAEVIPPAPERHFNDYANVTTDATARQLDQELEAFERQTSNQIVAAIYPKMQSDSSIDDYCIRTFNAWQVGQKGKNNGAVLFVFVGDHKTFIVTGYGLEGALPDATCKLIIEQEITPRFKAGDFNGGMAGGVRAMMAATRGEYKGTGRTAHDGPGAPSWAAILVSFLVFGVLVTIMETARRYRRVSVVDWYFSNRGRRGNSGWYGGSGRSGGGYGGSSSGGGGGGFSGGGGRSGGGGAGGSW